jgi:hypothetical protein
MNQKNEQNETPKIVVDQDWKAQAQKEKERLAAEQAKTPKETPAAGAGQPGEMPPASFATLVSTVASQALFAMGAFPDPQTRKRYVNLDLAKHQIDTLKVLEAKTAGNLTDEEKKLLASTLYELRGHYVQVAQQVTKI